jgi:uncharacterized protein involved in exopolysaccharide biosynthesis
MDQMQIVHDMLRTLRRRALLIALLGAAGAALAAVVATSLPARYETSARILVESQQIPDELARSTVTSSAVERLNLIEQRLMSRDSLTALIERLGLYADRPDMSLGAKVEALRAATEIRSEILSPANPRSGVAASAIAIAVTWDDPVQAAAIANELVSAMLQQNLQTRSEQTRRTLRFFDEERDRLAAEISRLDGEITVFKTENEAVLPDSLEFRRDEIGRLLATDLEIDRRLLALEEQRGALQAGLSDDGAARPLSPEETLARQLETELAQARLRLAESHPEIQDLRGRIEAVRAIAGREPTAEDPDAARPSASARAVGRQIELLESQIGLLEEQRRATAVRRAEIEASLQITPTVETTLAGLTRRRAELLDQYQTIINKRAEAETGERLEASQQAERFEVIENALPPEWPAAPSRKKILAAGVVASFGLAAGLAVLLEMLNPAIRSSADFQRQLQIAPLAAIPYVRTRRERLRRGAGLALAALAVVVAVPAGLWAVDRHVRPLQSIVERLAERAGVEAVIQTIAVRF